MAMTARDTLENAIVYKKLSHAVSDASLVVGTSRRLRRFKSNWIPFDKAIQMVSERADKQKVCILFGKESMGMDNDSLDLCDWVTTIPTGKQYPSLNLSQAVIIVSFSLFQKKMIQADNADLGCSGESMTKHEISDVLATLHKALEVLDYSKTRSRADKRIINTFHQMFKRGGLLKREAQMLK